MNKHQLECLFGRHTYTKSVYKSRRMLFCMYCTRSVLDCNTKLNWDVLYYQTNPLLFVLQHKTIIWFFDQYGYRGHISTKDSVHPGWAEFQYPVAPYPLMYKEEHGECTWYDQKGNLLAERRGKRVKYHKWNKEKGVKYYKCNRRRIDKINELIVPFDRWRNL